MKEQTSTHTDEGLWQTFKEGSEASFDLIYEKTFSSLYAYGYRLCRDEELVKDCIQNMFIEIWQKRQQLSEVHTLRHYLFKILRRKIFHEVEKKAQANNHLQLALSGSETDFFFSSQVDRINSDDAFPEEVKNRLKVLLSRLSSRQKEAVVLKFYENMSYAEISEIMGLKDAKYARQLIYRSLNELKRCFEEEYNFSLTSHSLYLCLLYMGI